MNHYIQDSVEIAKNLLAAIPLLRSMKEKLSVKRDKTLSDVSKPFQICQHLLRSSRIDLKDKIILEIGPGNFLATGLLYLALGAKKVYLLDRFKHIFWDKKDITFHKAVFAELAKRNYPYREAVNEAVTITTKSIELNPDLIEYRLGDAAELPFENESIDFIFSNAVMEHIHNPEDAVKEFARVTKAGGLNSHEIDLRDHFFKSTPLRLLKYSDTLWNLMAWNRPGYTNRLRFSDWIMLFKRYFKIELIKQILVLNNRKILNNLALNKKFKKYSKEELRILAFWVFLSK